MTLLDPDYTPHELEARRQLKEAHNLLLKHQSEEALEHVLNATAELRLMGAVVRGYVERKNAKSQ